MIVKELINLFEDEYAQEFALWDCKENDIIFIGTLDKIPAGLEFEEVKSIDNISLGDAIVINIDTE